MEGDRSILEAQSTRKRKKWRKQGRSHEKKRNELSLVNNVGAGWIGVYWDCDQ